MNNKVIDLKVIGCVNNRGKQKKANDIYAEV